MKTDHKVMLGIGLLTIALMTGLIWSSSKESNKRQAQLAKPLMGEKIVDQGGNHVKDGTKVDYNSNPPTSGPHYVNPQSAGIYDKPIPDGNLVHSMEHGAVIIWYQSNLAKDQIEQLKNIYYSVGVNKKIMVPRDNLDVPVALTSWGRLLKLQAIDEAQIKEFMETNNDRAPEKASI